MDNVRITKNKKKARIRLVHKMEKNENVNEMEVDILNKNEISCLESVKIEKSLLGGMTLSVEVQDKVTLSEYLSKAINAEDFLQLVIQSIRIIRECESSGVRMCNLETDPEKVFVDPEGKVTMVYWPLTRLDEESGYIDFFKKFGECFISLSPESSIKKQYMELFNSRLSFDLYKFEKKIRDMVRQLENKKARNTGMPAHPYQGKGIVVNPIQKQPFIRQVTDGVKSAGVSHSKAEETVSIPLEGRNEKAENPDIRGTEKTSGSSGDKVYNKADTASEQAARQEEIPKITLLSAKVAEAKTIGEKGKTEVSDLLPKDAPDMNVTGNDGDEQDMAADQICEDTDKGKNASPIRPFTKMPPVTEEPEEMTVGIQCAYLLLQGDVSARIDLTKPVFLIGRSKTDCDFTIPGGDLCVSRRHCSIIKKQLEYYLRNDSKTNPTFLNGKSVSLPEGEILHSGDRIDIGNQVLTFFDPFEK